MPPISNNPLPQTLSDQERLKLVSCKSADFFLKETSTNSNECSCYTQPTCRYTGRQNGWSGWPVYEVRCLCSRRQEWRMEGCHSHQLFNIWFLWHEELVIWISLWYLHWPQNAKTLRSLISFHTTAEKNGHPNFKDLPFWSHWRYHGQI